MAHNYHFGNKTPRLAKLTGFCWRLQLPLCEYMREGYEHQHAGVIAHMTIATAATGPNRAGSCIREH